MTHREATTLSTELQCFTALHQQEQAAAPRRIEALAEELSAVRDAERVLQKRYEGLAETAGHLRQLVAAAEAEATRAAKAEADAAKLAAADAAATETEAGTAEATNGEHLKDGAAEARGNKAEAPASETAGDDPQLAGGAGPSLAVDATTG